MKKFTLLFALLVSMVLLSSSCEKEEMVTPDPVDNGITANDLVGDWDFKLLEMPDGTQYDNCGDVPSGDWDLLLFNLNSVTKTTFTFYSICNSKPVSSTYVIDSKTQILTMNYGSTSYLKWKLISIVTLNNVTTLKMKLVDIGYDSNFPLNGTYTLTK